MPETTQLLLLAGLTAGVVLAVGLLGRRLLARGSGRVVRRLSQAPEDGESPGDLMLQPPPSHWASRLDLAFDRMVRRTGLDITPPCALLGTLTLGVGFAAALVVWRNSFALGMLGLFLGTGVPLVGLLLMQSRWRRQLQDQLPSALYVLARGLRTGRVWNSR